ncbi:acyl carrier protein [Streptococcus pneumoniae]|uniref:acyl carrier protein n=1 Tax=Streptococcus pneumoniae TaxID=1313 RepID=UPI0005EA42CD|nr:acyl carrier protein [Streptococcus pneumoniae]CKI33253.1 acyl carrier protein [Streptococcus pneumoniae]CKI33563.1 acyl carrier protein [Streptococcus pneumoniae]VIU60669.1 acyl carrier protein [Streptococcus pneumoniae]VIU79621.1 acyl carrier protein [Streptococcus pneumoniae]VIV40344.1 acyl carrier protein [Streptococcus pneumoniae]
MKDKIKNIIADITERKVEEISFDLELVDELEIDSMMSLEILTDLERDFDIVVTEEDFANFITVNDIYELVKGKVNEK